MKKIVILALALVVVLPGCGRCKRKNDQSIETRKNRIERS